ncbi:MAG: hypothetical protein AAFY15_01680, partial [Cyanobacteria bacterium J06648_11]
HVPQGAIAPTQTPALTRETIGKSALPAPESIIQNSAGLTRSHPTAVANARQTVRGLACQRSDRDLVLVDRHNRILNCLTPAQQALLNHHIDLALASRGERRQLPGVLKFLNCDRFHPQLKASESNQPRLPLAAGVGTAIATLRDRIHPKQSDLTTPSSASLPTAKSPNSLTAIIRAAWEYFAHKRSPAVLPQAARPRLSARESVPQLAQPSAPKSLGLPIPPTLLTPQCKPRPTANRDRSSPLVAPVLNSLPTQPKLNMQPVRRSTPARRKAIAMSPNSLPTGIAPSIPVAVVKSSKPAARVIAEAWADTPTRRAVVPVSRSRVPIRQSKPASQQIIDTRSTSLGYDTPWQQRVLDRVDRFAYGVETVAESAGDRARFASHQTWHQIERRVQPVRDRHVADQLQTAIWTLLTAAGAGIVTFAEVLLPFAISVAIRALRLIAIASWMLLRGSLALLAIGLTQLVDFIER